jgi:glycosyltransferase involved in cell wall biosynthesis
MEVAARELIRALVETAPEGYRFTALINREAAEAGDGPWGEILPARVVPVNARSRVQWVLGEQVHVPRIAERHGVDIVHSLASTAPFYGRFKRVTTIHDLIYLHYPDAHPGLRTLGMRVLLPAAAKTSHRVVADSTSTRDDLVEHFKLPAEKVDVVPLGGQRPVAAPLPEADLRARLELGDRPLILAVSAKRPHKNLLRLIEAHALLEAPRPLLVLPGYATWHEDELRERARALGIAGDVRFEGWLSPEELEGLYAAATCFAFPSLYEGFGMPVLEAMERGLPVVTSDRSSLPEVAGDAALVVDPEKPEAIADALRRLLSDGDLREDLRRRGRERARAFTWEASAAAMLASYEKTLAAS